MAGSRLVLPSQQPVQSTGLPYPGGQLFFYVSDTTTPANTYQDAALVTPNPNPVILDSAGDAGNVFLDQSIVYKMALLDATGDLIWTFDPVYPFAPGTIQGVLYAGVTTGSANTQYLSGLPAPYDGQTITYTAGYANTMSATLNTGKGNVFLYQQGSDGPALLTGGEQQVGVRYEATYNVQLNDNDGGWQIIGAVSGQGIGGNSALLPFYESTSVQEAYAALGGYVSTTGRLTLTSGTPALTGAVSAATAVLFTPYLGNQVPVWNATLSAWSVAVFSELTCTLSDATLSPAAAVANALYDLFVWSNSGTAVLSRGPAWTDTATRSLALARINGVLTNGAAITNGPAINLGVYVGTIATDSTGGTVTFNPNPAAASGGPTGGAWVGLWNQYNRLPVRPTEIDNTSNWTYTSNTWRPADNSQNNRITFVVGEAEDYLSATYMIYMAAENYQNFGNVGLGLDSITSAGVSGGVNAFNLLAGAASATVSPTLVIQPLIGKHYVQALELSQAGTTNYYGSGGQMVLSADLKY